MKATELLAELERLNAILDDPNADNTAGRVESIQYDVLPTLMRQERHLILKALRTHVKPSHFQTEFTIITP
jgi:hypothetical protein